MDGHNLKLALERNEWSGKALAKAMGKAQRTVYEWFSKKTLKLSLFEEISEATGIAINELRIPENTEGLTKHHGRNIQKIIKNQGVIHVNFARKMNISRGTLSRRLKENEWEMSEILLAARVLNVPVAQIKGTGEGQNGFEKDIYEQLARLEKANTQLSQKLDKVLELLCSGK